MATCSLLDHASAKAKVPRRVMSVHIMCAREDRSGYFIPYQNQANSGTIPGKKTAGKRSVALMPGRALAWINNEASYFLLPAPAHPIFMAAIAKEQNLFANSVVCLEAANGRRVWHYQLVHHDTWDYDLPTPPNLVTLKHNGKSVDAVVQVTKTGNVFVFERETGKPLFDIEERKVPLSDIEGEESWPTQPFPAKPAPFVRQRYTEEDISDISPAGNGLYKRAIEKRAQ